MRAAPTPRRLAACLCAACLCSVAAQPANPSTPSAPAAMKAAGCVVLGGVVLNGMYDHHAKAPALDVPPDANDAEMLENLKLVTSISNPEQRQSILAVLKEYALDVGRAAEPSDADAPRAKRPASDLADGVDADGRATKKVARRDDDADADARADAGAAAESTAARREFADADSDDEGTDGDCADDLFADDDSSDAEGDDETTEEFWSLRHVPSERHPYKVRLAFGAGGQVKNQCILEQSVLDKLKKLTVPLGDTAFARGEAFLLQFAEDMDRNYDLDILVQQETNPHAKQGTRINAAGPKKWQLYWDHSVRFQELAREFRMLEVLGAVKHSVCPSMTLASFSHLVHNALIVEPTATATPAVLAYQGFWYNRGKCAYAVHALEKVGSGRLKWSKAELEGTLARVKGKATEYCDFMNRLRISTQSAPKIRGGKGGRSQVRSSYDYLGEGDLATFEIHRPGTGDWRAPGYTVSFGDEWGLNFLTCGGTAQNDGHPMPELITRFKRDMRIFSGRGGRRSDLGVGSLFQSWTKAHGGVGLVSGYGTKLTITRADDPENPEVYIREI